MAEIVLQHTNYNGSTIGNVFVWDDDTVTDADTGLPRPDAVVTHNDDGSISVDVSGNGMQDIDPYPELGRVRITREPGWQGVLGWRAELLEWDDQLIDPGVYALAVYAEPDGVNYQFTTGGFVWNGTYWSATCPPGFEPGQNDVYFGMLYASISYSTFTLRDYIDQEEFTTGGTPP